MDKKSFSYAIESCFGSFIPGQQECSSGKKRVLILYAQPYNPLLKTACQESVAFKKHFGKCFLGAGQLLAGLPQMSVTYFFWKIDVVEFKHLERKSAKKICRRFNRKYQPKQAPWITDSQGHYEPLKMTRGPSWKWWTKWFNEQPNFEPPIIKATIVAVPLPARP